MLAPRPASCPRRTSTRPSTRHSTRSNSTRRPASRIAPQERTHTRADRLEDVVGEQRRNVLADRRGDTHSDEATLEPNGTTKNRVNKDASYSPTGDSTHTAMTPHSSRWARRRSVSTKTQGTRRPASRYTRRRRHTAADRHEAQVGYQEHKVHGDNATLEPTGTTTHTATTPHSSRLVRPYTRRRRHTRADRDEDEVDEQGRRVLADRRVETHGDDATLNPTRTKTKWKSKDTVYPPTGDSTSTATTPHSTRRYTRADRHDDEVGEQGRNGLADRRVRMNGTNDVP